MADNQRKKREPHGTPVDFEILFMELTRSSALYNNRLTFKNFLFRRSIPELLTLVSIICLASGLLFYFIVARTSPPTISYEQLKSYIQADQIETVIITGEYVRVQHKTEGTRDIRISSTEWDSILPDLITHNVPLRIPNNSVDNRTPFIRFILIGVGVLGLYIFYKLVIRKPSPTERFTALSRSRANLINTRERRYSFTDIVVPEYVRQHLEDMIDFLKEPQKFKKLGGRITGGFLLAGPSGIGKTLMGRVLASEANVPVFQVSGAEFVEVYLGTGAARMRDLFEQARKNAPCIVFIDDIDVIAKTKGLWADPIQLEYEMTLIQLLALLRPENSSEGVIVIGTTNRLDLIDETLIRPGRLHPVLEFTYPTMEEVIALLKIYGRKIPLSEDVDLEELATIIHHSIPQCTGSIVSEISNQAAVIAAGENLKIVRMADYLKAIESFKVPGSTLEVR